MLLAMNVAAEQIRRQTLLQDGIGADGRDDIFDLDIEVIDLHPQSSGTNEGVN